MANRYFLNIGANWGDTANWSDTSGGTGGFSVPTNLDDVFFNGNSGNCTVNASNRTAKTLNFTGYTNTITMTFAITVSGNVTLSNTMTVAGTGRLQFDTNATITSNGKEWGNIRIFLNGIVLTLADDFTVNNVLFDIANSATATINGNKFKIKGDLDYGGRTGCEINGTTTLMMVGTGSLLALSSRVATSTFEVDTTGTFTINGGIINSANVKYTAGNVTYTTTLLLAATQSVNWTHTITGAGIQLAGTGNTITLLNNINTNTISYGNADGVTVTVNGFQINCTGNLTIGRVSGTLTGSTIINLTGGTWSHSGATVLRMPLVLNGNITISGNVYYNTGTLTYTSGTVTTTGSTLNVGANTTFNTSGMTWNNVSFTTSASVYTLLSDINISGTLNNQQNNSFNGAFNINTTGTITAGGNIAGTSTLNILGGTLNATTGNISCNLNFNGNISIISNLTYRTNTIKYISGVITLSANHTLNVQGNVDTNSMVWNNVTINGAPITFLSDFNVGGLLTHSNNITYNGAFNLNLYGGLNLSSGDMNPGSTTINLFGGTWTVTNPGVYQSRVSLPTVIRGFVTISGNVYFGGTLRFVNGQLNTSNGILNLLQNSIFIDCDKINFRTVVITAGTTQTFNKFFNGTASFPTRIQCATSTGTYTVAFQDTFEKIANNVKISGCIVSRPGQLILNGNSNKGTNTGIRYINQSPNGLPKNSPPIPTQMTYGIGNISDPTRVVS